MHLLAVALQRLGAGPFGMQGLEWRSFHRFGRCGAAECQLVGAVEQVRRHGSLSLDLDRPARPHANAGPSAAATRSVTWISPGSPCDSIRLAVFTVSPQRS